MNRLNIIAILVGAAGFYLLTNCTSNTSIVDKPNIIYIMMDEWGYFEWSTMGHPILQTPNIDKMASEGIRFTQFLAGGNVCAPTRSTLMTGQHTGHTTVRGNFGVGGVKGLGGGDGRVPLRAEDVTFSGINGAERI